MALKMDDGTEREFGPGDTFHMPPGHDAWIVGDEVCAAGLWGPEGVRAVELTQTLDRSADPAAWRGHQCISHTADHELAPTG
jgi:hypothetical protein